MSLKQDYSGSCTSGFDADMALVFKAGRDLVAINTAVIPAVAAGAVIHQNDLDGGITPGDVVIKAIVAGVVGNSISITGDGIETVAALAAANGFTVESGDSTQILEDGDVITLSGGVDEISATSVVNATLSSGLIAAAAAGNTSFTINVLTNFEPTNLRLKGVHQQTYFAGIIHELAEQGIFSMYVSLVLNTSDTASTSVDFKFNF